MGDINLVRVTAGAGHTGQRRELFGRGGGKAAGVHVQLLQKLGDEALLLRCKGVEQMLRLQGVVLVLHGQLLRGLKGFQRLLGILIGIHRIDLHSYRVVVLAAVRQICHFIFSTLFVRLLKIYSKQPAMSIG